MIKMKLLKAKKGDCIIIEFGDQKMIHRIIIDSGDSRKCNTPLGNYIKEVKKENQIIDLMVLTHYDDDHINGFLALLENSIIDSALVKKVWMNYGTELSKTVKSTDVLKFTVTEKNCKTTADRGKDFYNYLNEKGIELKSVTYSNQELSVEGARFIILSPSLKQIKRMLREVKKIDDRVIPFDNEESILKTAGSNKDFDDSIDTVLSQPFNEDNRVANCSSIAFIFEYNNHRILFLGDSAPSQIVTALEERGYSNSNKLKLDYCKLSHHGSNYNTSDELIKLLDCQNYIICSNWSGDRPGKQCLSRVVVNNDKKTNFFCNYPHKDAFTKDEMEKYGISFVDIESREIVLEE